MATEKTFQSLIVDSQLTVHNVDQNPVIDKLIGCSSSTTTTTGNYSIKISSPLLETPTSMNQTVTMPLNLLAVPGCNGNSSSTGNHIKKMEFATFIEAPESTNQLVLMPLNLLTVPGTDFVPFYISPSGELILASMKVNNAQSNGIITSSTASTMATGLPQQPAVDSNQTKTTSVASLVTAVTVTSSISTNPIQTTAVVAHGPPPLIPMVTGSSINDGNQPAQCDVVPQKPAGEHCNGMISSSEEELDKEISETTPQDPLSQKICKILRRRHHRTHLTDDIIVEDINISEIQQFADRLRQRRREWFLSQFQLAKAITEQLDTPVVSQSFLCRFEKLDVTVRAASRLLPHLERWLTSAEHRLSQAGGISAVIAPITAVLLDPAARLLRGDHPDAYIGVHEIVLGGGSRGELAGGGGDSIVTSSTSAEGVNGCPGNHHGNYQHQEEVKKRKRRTCFSHETLQKLHRYFHNNAHPTGKELTDLAKSIDQDREVVRVWFCNKRQQLSKIQHTVTASQALPQLTKSPSFINSTNVNITST